MQTVSHFEANPSQSYGEEKLQADREELDRLLRTTINLTRDELTASADTLEGELNQRLDPKKAARQRGLGWIRRKSEDNEE